MSKRTVRPRLEINSRELRENLLLLFGDMAKNERLRESFIQSPTKLITQRVVKEALPPQQISEANRLLFSLVANDEMVEWLENYEKDNPNRKMDKKRFAMDFAQKITELHDDNILVSLISNAVVGNGIPGLTTIAYQCVCNETPNKYECACTPVAKDSKKLGKVDPDMLRSITEHLITYAKRLSKEGKLADLSVMIR